jgi:maltooligosyltrehalose synthase
VTNLVVHGQFPLGPEVWEDTTLALPDGAPVDWRDALTGESQAARRAGASLLLDASALFARLPVAVVRSVG